MKCLICHDEIPKEHLPRSIREWKNKEYNFCVWHCFVMNSALEEEVVEFIKNLP